MCVKLSSFWYLQLQHHKFQASHPFLLICNFFLWENCLPPSTAYLFIYLFWLHHQKKRSFRIVNYIPPGEILNHLIFKAPEINYVNFWDCNIGLGVLEFPRWFQCLAKLKNTEVKGQHAGARSFSPFSLCCLLPCDWNWKDWTLMQSEGGTGCSLLLGKLPLPAPVWQEGNYSSLGLCFEASHSLVMAGGLGIGPVSSACMIWLCVGGKKTKNKKPASLPHSLLD